MTEPVTIPLGFAADGARQQPGLEASRLTGLPATSHGAGASGPPTRSGRRHRPSSRAATPVTPETSATPHAPSPPALSRQRLSRKRDVSVQHPGQSALAKLGLYYR